MESQAIGLLLCDDLIFTSRIIGTARDLGYEFKTARSTAALKQLLETDRPVCLILDLADPDLLIADFMSGVRQLGESVPRVVAYGSHVDTATLKAARAAGCDTVLTRSQFVEELPVHLADWMTNG